MNGGQDPRRNAEGAKSKIQRALKLSPLFERVSRTTREAVIGAAVLEVAPANTVILAEGMTADALLLLGRGRARVERRSSGRTFPLGYRGPGDVLGEACLGREKKHAETATTMEEAEVVRIPLAIVDDLSSADPSIGPAIVTLLVARQREVEDRIESMLFRNVEARLAEFLLKSASRWGVPVPQGVLISAPLTHLEIAQAIGSTRETVTLTLGSLRREGLLDVAGRRLIVKDREALAARQ